MEMKTVEVKSMLFLPIPNARKITYAWQTNEYIKLTDDKGNEYCIVDRKLVSKEVGNNIYIKRKVENAHYQKTEDCKKYCKKNKINPSDTFIRTEKIETITVDELVNCLLKSVDEYTEYIDNAHQQRLAEDFNDKIYRTIRWLNGLK